ncbi:hypothetical protein BZA70DRAFT_273570 [Myxozyma melibiosi]|uniref:tryptophan--tRNA ligase n=1 Tax=Myxozyma melibiosi TaxID=54550 RepID=A0ABR1FEX9_9ASCO
MGRIIAFPTRRAAKALSFRQFSTAAPPTSRNVPEQLRDAPQTIFSGIQPTGIAHLGNYLGALSAWGRLCARSPPSTRLIFSIVDLHALTVPPPADLLREYKRQCAAMIIASGVDPKKCVLYVQSAVPAHAELCWILTCMAEFGYLSRMTQWKSKLNIADDASTNNREAQKNLKLGLFAYPVLQAADILLYQTNLVPVGDDQVQHLELTRHIADRFNARHKVDVFRIPEVLLTPTPRIMSLKNPTKKMSKSDPTPATRIMISDTTDQIAKKIRGAVTDSITGITYEPVSRPGVANLIDIVAGILEQPQADVAEQYASMTHGEFKAAVTDVVCAEMAPVRRRFEELSADPEYIDLVLKKGAEKASEIAQITLDEVKKTIGLL